ncbi:MAG: ATP-binding cassette domain-containing protein [Flavobacteriales bacterium]|nr:putative ABC transporter ATP-binding protein YxlF [Flavobacteriales bacterium]MCC6576879.1 ATP-binding cassette domain-containing protein [Flavobacteriales bacterium]
MDIRIEGLTKRYGQQAAVDGIGLHVRPGEVLGFLGPNGAGKTTTMKMICGLLAPDAGSIEVGGRSVLTDQQAVRRHIGYLPENNPLYEDMPVLDHLRFAARLQGLSPERIRERLGEMVRVCGLDAEKHKRVGELSKGYRQRVGLAQAMVHDPEVLILDEPTTGLDPNQIVEIRELIKEVGRAKTVIFSTHILPEVEATCDRILIINRGRIVADGSPTDLRRQAQGRPLVRVRIEDAPPGAAAEALRTLPGVEQVETANDGALLLQTADGGSGARQVFRLCVDRGWTLTELHSPGSRLEDIFRDLTLN